MTASPRARSEPGADRVAALAAALVVATFAAFSGVIANSFLTYDDDAYVTNNAHVVQGLSAKGVAWAITSDDAANWHPVTWLSHMLDVQLFVLDARGHHATSLVLHAVNALILFLLLVRMTGALWRSAFVAGLFAVHPLHVESVAWIAERKDVLSTLFWLLTIAAWVRWTEEKTRGRYALVVASFTAGLMAKPMLVTLPLTLMLLDVWPLKRAAIPVLWREKLPLFAMSAASAGVTFVVQRSGGAVQSLQGLTFATRVANAAEAYVWYLGKTFWPTGLACFYPHPGHVRPGLAIGAVVLLSCATALAVRFARRAPYLTFGWAWYVLTLVPVIGLVQVGDQAMADRYTYVSLVGIFIAIAWGFGDLGRRSQAARIAVSTGGVASIAVLLALTRIQVSYWAGNESLFAHALAVTSDNWMAHNGLGGAFAHQGRTEAAIAQFEEVIRLRPAFGKGHYNLAVAFSQGGRFQEAIEQYRETLRLDHTFTEAHYNLGKALDEEGDSAEAMASYRKVIELDPARADAWTNLGIDLHKTGEKDEALKAFLRSDQLKPGVASTKFNIGLEREALGQISDALAAYEQARRLDPSIAALDAALGRVNRSRGARYEEQSRWSEAREAFEQVTRLTPDDAESWAHLALAYQNERNFDRAAGAYREAIRLNPSLVICRFNLGILALKAGDEVGAVEQLEALNGLDAKLAESLQALIQGRRGAASK